MCTRKCIWACAFVFVSEENDTEPFLNKFDQSAINSDRIKSTAMMEMYLFQDYTYFKVQV